MWIRWRKYSKKIRSAGWLVGLGLVNFLNCQGNLYSSQADIRKSCQFCPSVPQAIFLDSGGFLNFTEKICRPNEGTARNLPQLCCLNEAATIRIPQLLLNNEITPVRLPSLLLNNEITTVRLPQLPQ
jgi:hypothetical protein